MLKKELLRAAHETPAKDVTRHFRLPIDRSFATKGFGTVVTGTLISGSVKVKDEVEIYPMRQRVRVRGLHSGGKAIEQAVAGQRTAVNLAGHRSRGREARDGAGAAGDLRVDEASGRANHAAAIRAAIARIARRCIFMRARRRRLPRLCCWTGAELAPGESALVQLRLDDEILLLPGDRFILRQFSPVVTIGGGIVVDARPTRHKRNDPAVGQFLERVERGSPEEVLAAIAEAVPRGLTLEDMVARTGWLEADVRATVKKLVEAEEAANPGRAAADGGPGAGAYENGGCDPGSGRPFPQGQSHCCRASRSRSCAGESASRGRNFSKRRWAIWRSGKP